MLLRVGTAGGETKRKREKIRKRRESNKAMKSPV